MLSWFPRVLWRKISALLVLCVVISIWTFSRVEQGPNRSVHSPITEEVDPTTRVSNRLLSRTVQQSVHEELPFCPDIPPGLYGAYTPDVRTIPSESDLEAKLDLVGGCWRPAHCRPRNGSLAVIFPSHKRRDHLLITVKHLVPILQRQLQDFCIYAGEQAPGSANERFNKGATADASFREAMRDRNWTCVCIHDVDMIPESDHISYSCPVDHVRHLTAAISKFGYSLPYPQVFGGGTISMASHFVQYNGLSTAFWGWGTEDDDHRQRIGWAGLRWDRQDKRIARFTHIPHSASPPNPNRFWFAMHARQVWQDYGLNTLQYDIAETERKKLFTRWRFRFPDQGPGTKAPHTQHSQKSS